MPSVYATLGRHADGSIPPLIPAEALRNRIAALAQRDPARRAGRGSAPHLRAQRRRAVSRRSRSARWTGSVTIDFMALSSYGGGTTSSGEVRLIKDLDYGLEGRNVIIVEDIVDTGLTLHYLQEILRARNPKSLRTACLLEQAVAPQDRGRRRLHRLHHRRSLRRRLRPRLLRAVSQSAVYRRSAVERLQSRISLRGQPSAHGRAYLRRRACAPRASTCGSSASAPSRRASAPYRYDGRLDVVAARRVDEMRDRVVHRRLPRPVHPDDDHVGQLAGLERAEVLSRGR